MKAPKNAESSSMLVQGISLKIPVFVTPETLGGSTATLDAIGVPLDSASSILQQTVVENVRNNTAKHVNELIAKALPEGREWDGKLGSLDDDEKAAVASKVDMKAAQKIIDDYVTVYTPGVRSVSAGEPIDPVAAMAQKLAKQSVQDRLENKAFTWDGSQYSGVGRTARSESYKAFDAYCQAKHECSAAAFVDKHTAAAVEKYPYFTEKAKQQLEEAKKATEQLDFAV